MTRFRPCIDLHQGQVKQIVGGSLTDDTDPDTNFVAAHDAAWYADRYHQDDLRGGHIIKLGPGNDDAARQALAAWPQGMHLGGGINAQNAKDWLDAGAEKLIVTSYLFDEQKQFSMARLKELHDLIGRERLIVDLSCRKSDNGWCVATDRWQTVTDFAVNADNLQRVAAHCSEFLIHAADIEGKCEGIDKDLVSLLGQHCEIPCCYAGGGRDISDLQTINDLSNGKVDLTYGSALDLFGGKLVKYSDCLEWNKQQA